MDKHDIRSRVEEFLGILLSAVQTRSVYGKDHNLTKNAVDKLHSALSTALSDRKEITLGIIGNEIAFGEKPLYEISKKAGKLGETGKSREKPSPDPVVLRLFFGNQKQRENNRKM